MGFIEFQYKIIVFNNCSSFALFCPLSQAPRHTMSISLPQNSQVCLPGCLNALPGSGRLQNGQAREKSSQATATKAAIAIKNPMVGFRQSFNTKSID